jgi:hypothetical protein
LLREMSSDVMVSDMEKFRMNEEKMANILRAQETDQWRDGRVLMRGNRRYPFGPMWQEDMSSTGRPCLRLCGGGSKTQMTS